MKKILLISAVIMMAAACHKEPYGNDDGEYLVYTTPGKDVDFSPFKTYYLADSLLVIGSGDNPQYSQSDNAMELIERVRNNMENYGYVYTSDRDDADLGIQMTFVIKTERFVKYYSNPYWWLDYPGYWLPGFWGNWCGFYYPYPISYTYSTNALMIDMVNLDSPQGKDEKLEVVWSSYIGGPAGYSLSSDIDRIEDSIDQAFVQSPYLKKTK